MSDYYLRVRVHETLAARCC